MSSRFQRWILPGLAFKAAVIGGGYATGRELAEYFIPSGPQGGMAGIVVAMLAWSTLCALTFAFAHATRSHDYRSFFASLLGPFAFVFELAYLIFIVLILAVFGAAAGAIGQAMFGWHTLVGTLLLVAGIGAFTAYGNESVERLFKWVSFFLYGVYVLFFLFTILKFGHQASQQFATPVPTDGWLSGGLTYAGYNIVGAVMILPLARHFLTRRDAVVAGVLAGPLAMLPGLLFFTCMIAWYPAIGAEALPSDFMLRQLGMPLFHLCFQAMIFSALLESGTACVHAMNERIAVAWQARRASDLPKRARLAISGALLVGSIFIAARFGLVDLIARGYRALAWLFLVVYVVPLLTVGLWRLRQRAPRVVPAPQS
ncbi:hypothetical protein LYSHEL_10890 [Lysobacter helvus]|uniref:Membrane protein YkvI n=2 Tax=Lysobacteraceae TaxID=32033 RepID=A0ABN6FRW6_9GAMM|nr:MULTISPECIES: hypothetical protein [Lysobacter]BCT92065.1 hypothetical protein LYSCAS_10890 [Lysobacter caseinilyticus]BCT95218.1 hypothetical protein LYSHEL_10890 [Lysobacter helvus]